MTQIDIAALVADLTTKSAMINMGEKIAWGSETALMDQAAAAIIAQDAELRRLQAELASLHASQADAGAVMVDWKARAEALQTAIEALGAIPEGYCFCSDHRIGDDSKIHEPECADLRALLIGCNHDRV